MTPENTGKVAHASIRPTTSLDLLSRREILGLLNSDAEVLKTFRDCALAVMNSGAEQDDAFQVQQAYQDFEIEVIPESRGIKLEICNAPASAFVDGRIIKGIQEHLFSSLRDIVYTHYKSSRHIDPDLDAGSSISDEVFRILRNAGVVQSGQRPNLVVCWGGHSIDRVEYDYCKQVGYHLGLRALDIATGCGTGAMKAPMKGAVIGHGKQQIANGRYIGITEPGIIASESPNPTVSELVILPDIEKRLEAFVRLAHCIIVFPGGVGTLEEILYLVSILMHPDNKDLPVPVIFAAPEGRADYFDRVIAFLEQTLGSRVVQLFEVIEGNPLEVAREAKIGVDAVWRHRRRHAESYAFNWRLHIPYDLQQPFIPTHTSMGELQLRSGQARAELAQQLRCAFSGVVAGNVRFDGIEQVHKHGPFRLHGDPEIMAAMGSLLENFVQNNRMKLHTSDYEPCYEVVID